MRCEASKKARQPGAERDRPGVDTRLLPPSFPNPVSLGSPRSPLRKSLVSSAPSQSPVRKLPAPPYSRPIQAAYARSALPGVDADACVYSWMNARSALPGVERMPALTPRMISRSALPGVDADACGIAPRMISRSALPGVDADACGIAPRMISRSALPGVDADACVNPWMNARSALPGVERMPALTPWMTCPVPARTTEGALETPFSCPS